MKNNEYWAKRFKALEERSNAEAQKCVAESMKLIDDAIIQIDKDITYWLKRFADNNNMTLAEAKKAITNKELKELGWDVEEYIRKGYANSYLGNWDKELENASAKYHITRLDAIKMQMMLFCDKAFADITENVTQTLSNVYKDVYYRTAFEVQKGIGVGFSFAQVDERRLKLILEKPWAIDGTNFSERIWGTYRPKLTNKLQQALTDWCVRGTDPKKLARQLSYESNVAQSACNTLIRTETAQICTRAEMDSYDELGVEKYRVLETLDGKTCDMCADMDSKIFNRDDFEIGITAPPFHPRCRGTTIPEVTDDLLKQGRKRATRDENGKTIYVDDMSYKDWKEKFVSNDKFTSINNDDIIKSDRLMAQGQRKSFLVPLSDDDKAFINNEIEAIEADISVFQFRNYRPTGYSDERDKIYISSSVFPSNDGSMHPTDLLSVRATLAHEYYGHRKYRGTKVPQGSWNDEFRASYMAAKNCPNLSDEDRRLLVLDALERAKTAGVSVRYNNFIRKCLYGY
jgi:SPP1 gp7 family putative phage head morphogenesis protein